jgi:hypothetical protein
VKKVEKLNRTNTHNAKQTARKTNATIVTQIIDDTIEEYECAYIRMRSYGWIPHNAGFGVLDLAPSILHSNWFWDYIS